MQKINLGSDAQAVFNPTSSQQSDNLEYSIDSVYFDNKYVHISGWALKKGSVQEAYNWIIGNVSSVYTNNTIILQDDIGSIYKLNTFSVNRSNITSSMDDGISYGRCGVYAKIKLSALAKGHPYKVGILMKDGEGKKTVIFSDKVIKI